MKTPEKLDLWREHRDEYVAAKKPVLVETRPARYLAIRGEGAPGGPAFEVCIGTLYAMAYTLKMSRKFAGQQDYTIGKLEMLYWLGEGDDCSPPPPKESWRWQMLIRTPAFVSEAERERAIGVLREKGKAPNAGDVRFETIDEGPCVQMLHVGPYERISETIEAMRGFAEGRGLRLEGPHHEIYLSDPRRVAPEKLKTILRQPARPKA
jgi:hypothetical protein